jgi:hypothetical protein
MTEPAPPESAPEDAPRKQAAWQRILPWLITIACFSYLYVRIGAGAPEGQSVPQYLASVFTSVDWVAWLALMVPYSIFYFLIDTSILWRVVSWFNKPVRYIDLLPIRASTYIISILNEQVGKGAIAVYLNRKEGIPGWQVGSSMLFIMFCEFYYLLTWAVIGWSTSQDILPPILGNIRFIAAGAAIVLVVFITLFRSERITGMEWRNRHIFHAFRQAQPWKYLVIVLMRSPALLGAVWVYSQAAALFGVEIPLLDMLGILPVIFFGTLVPGPFRAVAVALWTTLFPDHVGEMAVFGLVQHNFFILFNAAIGLIFLRRANRELFDATATEGS